MEVVMVILFVLLAFLAGVPLYLDYKKNPNNNIITRYTEKASRHPALSGVLSKIEPHTKKYGIHPVYALGGGVLVLLFLILLII